jgi:hypothetical protein
MSKALPLALALFALAASGCGSYRAHRLPMGVGEAKSSFAPLASCASEKGYEFHEFDDSVNIKTAPSTWVQFMIQNDAYNMVIIVDDKMVAAPELEGAFTTAKTEGDALWACAKGHMGTGSVTPAIPSTPPPAAAAPSGDGPAIPAGIPEACAKLIRCSFDLGTATCPGGAADCKAKVKVEVSDDAAGCDESRKGLVEAMTPVLSMTGASVPASCN